MIKNVLLYFLIVSAALCCSCSKKNYSSLPEYDFKSEDKKPDYSQLNYWAAHPWKKNTSDSVSKRLRSAFKKDSIADVFFLYPTTLTSVKDERWNADIDDAEINAKTDYGTILYQASVFNEKCRIFAPRYRQTHLKAFFIDSTESKKYFEIAYDDIRTAFIYYLQNYNHGRPIIIASHSQGTKHAARLLKEFFDDKKLKNKLICAYIIGLPIRENYFTSLKACKDSTSTGCYVSWRTYKRGYTEPIFIAKEKYKIVVINPLTWNNDTSFISSSKNLGAVLLKFNKIVPKAVNANIHNNILWTSKPNIFGKIFLTKKNYHVGDINLFYMNIRENVKTRINSFLKQ